MHKLKKIKKLLKAKGKEYGKFENVSDFTIKNYVENEEKLQNLHYELEIFYFKKCKYSMYMPQYISAKFLLFNLIAKLARLNNKPSHEDSINDFLGYMILFKRNCKAFKDFKIKLLYPNRYPQIVNDLVERFNDRHA